MGFVWYCNANHRYVFMFRDQIKLTEGEDAYPQYVRTWPDRVMIPEPEDQFKGLPRDQRILKFEAVLQNPSSVKSYTDAYLLLRREQGNPVSEELIGACGTFAAICRSVRINRPPTEILDKARAQLARDPEAAAVFAVAMLGQCRPDARPEFVGYFEPNAIQTLTQKLAACPDWPKPQQ
jgi:hypothetical protein